MQHYTVEIKLNEWGTEAGSPSVTSPACTHRVPRQQGGGADHVGKHNRDLPERRFEDSQLVAAAAECAQRPEERKPGDHLWAHNLHRKTMAVEGGRALW